MKFLKSLLFLILAFSSVTYVNAQIGTEDGSLTAPDIDPNPLDSGGNGTFVFTVNNVNGSYPATSGITLTIEMSLITPEAGAASVYGPGADKFSWSYDAATNTLNGVQIGEIGSLYSGNVFVDFDVTGDSSESESDNGFGATIGNLPVDGNTTNNFASSFTWTEPVDGDVIGHLYLDTNNNGVQDAGEPDLPNVDVIVTDSNGDVQTVTSDADGNWTATVPAGATTADVDETDVDYPAGSTQTEGDDPTSVTALAGETVDAGNDGYYLPGDVFGHLYLDENNNGVQDAGEPDLANVDVIVTDSNGDTQTVASDADGNWMAIVPAGTTSADVDETDTDYPAGSTQTEGNDPTVVTAISGDSIDAGIDGYYVPSEVFGHLYLDENNNGMQDAGEPDLANVDVIITDSNGAVQTVTTDANGDYSAAVPVGTTTVDVDETDTDYPAGSTQTDGDDPTDVEVDPDMPTDAGNDGYFTPTEVFGHVYFDSNNNGVQDPGEPDLEDIDVIITDVNGDMQTVSTDANGDWSAAVPAGLTTIEVDEMDSDFPPGDIMITEGDNPTGIIADPDMPTDAGNDGYYVPTVVFGHLYLDENNNGTQDAGEPDLANVDVIITDSNGAVQTVTTDANGDYSAPVPVGTTTVDVDETDTDYPTGATQTEGDDPTVVEALAGMPIDAGDDGFYLPTEVFGHLYLDNNNNGTQDAGEPDLADVDVIVTDSNGAVQTVTTDADGNWSAPVPAGITTADVDETDADYPTGSIQTEGDDPTVVLADADMPINAGIDGYYLPTVIFGHLYLDENNNGMQDAGEADLANVDVIVTQSDGSTITATTDSNGDWSTTVLPGLTAADIDNNDPDYPAGSTQTEGNDPTVLNVMVGDNLDFGNDGFYIPTFLEGHVYFDSNNNGMQDAGEPNLDNVDVVISQSDGSTVTATTDNNGDWITPVLEGLTAADVDETSAGFPMGATQSEGSDPTLTVVQAGTTGDAGNDGYYIPSTVFGHIYIDENNNGMQDAGEADVANLDVVITESNGMMQTVTTDANGDWVATVFPGLTSAMVDSTDPEYPTGSTQTEGDDPSIVNALLGEDTDAGIDGYYLPAEVFGHLYLDENNNGMQDANEPDLSGIDVIVTDSNGDVQTVTTDVDGDWTATVPAGETTADIDETDTDFPADVVQSEGDDPSAVTAISGDSVDAGNDGYFALETDITPIISFVPGVVTGTTDMAFEIRIQELLNVPTSGTITVVMPKDPRLTFTWDPAMTSVGGVFDVNNPSWTYNSTNPSFHIWTTNDVIPAGSNLDIGFVATYVPENSNGEVTYTTTIISGSGSENNFVNNIDAETLVYFNN